MKPWKIIQELESNGSKIFKQETIAEHIDNEDFVEGLRLALDPLTTFGVKKVPVADVDGKGLTHAKFCVLAEKLKLRKLTGHDARDAIEAAKNSANAEAWNDWYRRILLKDLRAGFSASTVNKAKKKTIPLFEVMLAKDGAKHPKKLVGDVLIENKYDGVRAVVIVEDGIAKMFTRSGKPLNNFPHVTKALSDEIYNGYVFDSEVMSSDFQALMKQVQRKSNVQTEDCFLALFDVLPLEEFRAGKSTMNAIERKDLLEEWEFDSCVSIVDYERVDLDTDEGQKRYRDMNAVALENGYEGLMIKPVNAIYTCRRSDAWLKIKPFIEVTLTVVDIEEGTGKAAGMTGALICSGTDDGKYIEVNVGSGLTDAQRKEIWKAKDDVIGQLVEVRADGATQPETGGAFSLRFPRFKTFRGFAKGEKI